MRTPVALVVLAALLALPIVDTASPAAAKKKRATVTKSFTNAAPIVIPAYQDDEPAQPDLYPSEIAVNGLKKGKIRDVNVRLNAFTHFYPDDVQVLLVGPDGQTAILMAKAGGGSDVAGVTLRLDDEGASPLPDEPPPPGLQSGVFRPTNVLNTAIDFLDPAPAADANSALSVFDGSNPNGTWRLFVQDEYAPTDPGAFSNGWTLEIKAKVKAKKRKR